MCVLCVLFLLCLVCEPHFCVGFRFSDLGGWVWSGFCFVCMGIHLGLSWIELWGLERCCFSSSLIFLCVSCCARSGSPFDWRKVSV
jgi:hypothetical protein